MNGYSSAIQSPGGRFRSKTLSVAYSRHTYKNVLRDWKVAQGLEALLYRCNTHQESAG